MARALLLTYWLLLADKLILKFRLRFKLLEPCRMYGVLGRDMPEYFKAGILGCRLL